jgi:PiT family inorganic phosphate transporter
VIWAAFFNFIAAFVFGTMSRRPSGKAWWSLLHHPYVILAVSSRDLLGPSHLVAGPSFLSSHALIGGFGGAAVVYAGWKSLIMAGFLKIILFIFVAPSSDVLGFLLHGAGHAYLSAADPGRGRQFIPGVQTHLGRVLFPRPRANDAQKTMGIIVALMIGGGMPIHLSRGRRDRLVDHPFLHGAIALGT